MTVVRGKDSRSTSTPNAVMTTLASPSLARTDDLSMWKVAMAHGQQGPIHRFDVEQIWTVLAGRPAVEMAGETIHLAAGDTVAVPAEVVRRFTAPDDDVEFLVCGRGSGLATPVVDGEAGESVNPAWIS